MPFFSDAMPRDRFEILPEQPNCPTPRRIDKVKPLIDLLLANFQSVFYPGLEISVDERLELLVSNNTVQ